MTDIVYWLREHDRARDTDAWMSCEKAANEIERLRDALRAIRDYDGPIAVIFDGDDALAMKDIARSALGEKE